MKVYSWIGGDRPADVGRAAKEKMEEGFQAVKMNATEELQIIDSYDKIDAALERVAAIREACGKHFGIAIDFHGRFRGVKGYPQWNRHRTFVQRCGNTFWYPLRLYRQSRSG